MNNCHLSLEVLISCMNERDRSIISRSNIQCNAIVVNQCDEEKVDEWSFENVKGDVCHVKMIYTKERGLSRSRNMAIRNATCDICLICDDDEWLENDYETIIRDAYAHHPEKDVITFSLKRKNYSYPQCECKMGIRQILRTSSVQTTFKRTSIIDNSICFDPQMGSGSGNGGGEEIKFLMDCRRKKLELYYTPQIIATVKSENSQWFNGFTEKYFKDIFWAARRSLGTYLGIVYLFYWCLIRSNHFSIKISKFKMLKCSLQGFFEKR